MKPRVSHQKTAALTLVEVLVVIVILAVLAMIIIARNNRPIDKRVAQKINCINNLKQIGLAYRIWEGDHGDKYPTQTSVTNGGTMELTANGKNAWLNFLVMSNELSTPKVLVCPDDKEHQPPAANFSSQLVGHVSYFVGLDAADNFPKSVLSGDDNFAIGGVPIKSGLLEFSTNAPIAWTASRHKNTGNIGLADGSVWATDNKQLVQKLIETGVATNRLAIP